MWVERKKGREGGGGEAVELKARPRTVLHGNGSGPRTWCLSQKAREKKDYNLHARYGMGRDAV